MEIIFRKRHALSFLCSRIQYEDSDDYNDGSYDYDDDCDHDYDYGYDYDYECDYEWTTFLFRFVRFCMSPHVRHSRGGGQRRSQRRGLPTAPAATDAIQQNKQSTGNTRDHRSL
jgi:hypothetical protein